MTSSPRTGRETPFVAVGGGKASKGRTASRGSSSQDEKKRGEPHDRQQGATNLHGRRGKTVEVVRNHEDGTRGGWQPFSEGRRGNVVTGKRILRFGTMEGRSLDNPKRGCSAVVLLNGSDARRDGKAGVKVRRVRAIMFTHDTLPGRRDLEDPAERRRSRRGAVEAIHRGSDRVLLHERRETHRKVSFDPEDQTNHIPARSATAL
jgi:hypothetical protein